MLSGQPRTKMISSLEALNSAAMSWRVFSSCAVMATLIGWFSGRLGVLHQIKLMQYTKQARLLAGSGRIQVNQRVAVDLLVQRREIFADAGTS